MLKKIIFVFFLIILSINNVKAYEYGTNNNFPTQNLTVQNDFSDYMKMVSDKLEKHWIAPDFLENAHTEIIFKLDREGYVLNAKIKESSGNKIFDESAISALQAAEPFGNFPQNTTRETLLINYSFSTTLVKLDKMREYVDLSNKYFKNGDNQSALKYIDLAINEVQGDEKSYFLYEKRSKIKKAINDITYKEDYEKYKLLKRRVDIKRAHFVKHFAEIENTPFAYFYLAFCYAQIEDYDNAIAAINKSISMTEYNNQYKDYKIELLQKKQTK